MLAGLSVLVMLFLGERQGVNPMRAYGVGAFFCVLFAVLHLARTKVVLGERAVEIRWLGTTRRIALENLASVSADTQGTTHMLSDNLDRNFVTLDDAVIRIVPRDGAPVRVRIGGAGDAEQVARRDEMLDAIRHAAGVRE